jgi:SNF family Na+-dependent transporter
MLTVLIIRGATLSGAVEGIKFYIGTVQLSALKNPSVKSRDKKRFALRFCMNLGMERCMYAGVLCIKLL